jgi:hypothetical protein
VRAASDDERYLPRHAPAPYSVSEERHCDNWQVPLGTPTAGALRDDPARGTLPTSTFVTPDACNDMHDAPSCEDGPVSRGDAWLRRWMAAILAGSDYTSGKLVVVVTWDEGSEPDNHIATFVISPTTTRITGVRAYTHCSTLRPQLDASPADGPSAESAAMGCSRCCWAR